MKRLRTFLAISVVFLAAQSPASAAPMYSLTPTPMTWHQAEAYAVSQGGHLVAINDAAEQALLVGLFGGSTRYWIGLNDYASEGTFVWSNGDPVTYTNWTPTEPNNAGGNEDGVVMNWTQPGNWNDYPPNNDPNVLLYGIVELNTAVPEPSTIAIFGIFLAVGAGCWLVRRRGIQSI